MAPAATVGNDWDNLYDTDTPDNLIMSKIVSDLDKMLDDSSTEDSSGEGDAGNTCDLEMPSVGSVKHYEGLCRPCAHIWKPAGCSKGRDCTFCHICGEQDFQKKRKDNIARRRAKRKIAAQVGKVVDGDKGTIAERSEAMMCASPEDWEPALAASDFLGLSETSTIDMGALTGGPAWVPSAASLEAMTPMFGNGGLFDDAQLVGSLPKTVGEKVLPSAYSYDEPDTATPSSSEEGQDLRTPPRGLVQGPAGLARPSYSRTDAAYVADFAKINVDPTEIFSHLSLGEPARVHFSARSLEASCDKLAGISEQPTSCRHWSAPASVDDAALELAWVPVPRSVEVDPRTTAQTAVKRAISGPGAYGVPCILSEVPVPRSVEVDPRTTAQTAVKQAISGPGAYGVPCILSEVRKPVVEFDHLGTGSDCRPPPGLEDFLQTGYLLEPTVNTPQLPTSEQESSRRLTDDVELIKEAQLLSVGSAFHAKGMCRPCAHIWKPAGCSKGKDCEFCHACGEEDFQRRRKENAGRRKAKRALPRNLEQ